MQGIKIPESEESFSQKDQHFSDRKNRKNRDIKTFCLGTSFSVILYLILQFSYANHVYVPEKIPPIKLPQSCSYMQSSNKYIAASALIAHKINLYSNYTQQIKLRYQNLYKIDKYQEKQFCVVIPTYNNAKNQRYLNNIQSILEQQYQNMSIIIIDDASTDQTYQLINQYINKHADPTVKSKVTLKKNKQNKKALENIYWAIHNFCSQSSIVTIVDGDDFLINRYVLKLFNAIYSTQDVWMVYSNFMMGLNDKGYSSQYPESVINQRSYRYSPGFRISHQHTFYTKLFRKIKQNSLKDSFGRFFESAYDVAIYFPMAQMSDHRMKFINQATYYYVTGTGANDYQINQIEQSDINRKIRGKKPYEPIQSLN